MAVRSGGRASERGPKLLPERIVLSLQDAGEIFLAGLSCRNRKLCLPLPPITPEPDQANV